MEKETIIIKISIEAKGDWSGFHSQRVFNVESTRTEVTKKMEEITTDIDASFEQ